ncbi:hypothetical protein [Plantactinospora sp. DSM 117369]
MWLRTVLGAVYTAMAVGQMVSWSRMPDMLLGYAALLVRVARRARARPAAQPVPG